MVGLLKMPLFDVPTRLKKNLKHTSGNLLGLLGAQKKDIGAALQTLLGRVRLHFLIFSYGISPHQLSKYKCHTSLCDVFSIHHSLAGSKLVMVQRFELGASFKNKSFSGQGQT